MPLLVAILLKRGLARWDAALLHFVDVRYLR
jgi:hypothetical protein